MNCNCFLFRDIIKERCCFARQKADFTQSHKGHKEKKKLSHRLSQIDTDVKAKDN